MGVRPGRLLVVCDSDGTLAEGCGTRRPRRSCRSHAGPCVGWRASPRRGRTVSVAILTGRTWPTSRRESASAASLTSATTACRPARSGGRRPGPDRDHVPCRSRGIPGARRGARHAGAGGARAGRPGCSWNARVRRSRSTSARPRIEPPRGRGRGCHRRGRPRSPPHDLAHYRGRLVVDLRPRTAGGKGEAFEALLTDLEPATVVAFGDDSSDADGFAVLRAARHAGTLDGLAVAVIGPHGMPEEVRTAADLVLDTPRDVARALSALARAVEREG